MPSFALRLPDHLLSEARLAAAEEKVSINQLLLSFVAEGLGQRRGLRMMRDRAAQADMAAVLDILNKVPDVPPEPGDELPRRIG